MGVCLPIHLPLLHILQVRTEVVLIHAEDVFIVLRRVSLLQAIYLCCTGRQTPLIGFRQAPRPLCFHPCPQTDTDPTT